MHNQSRLKLLKYFALFLFVLLPILAFYAGMNYQNELPAPYGVPESTYQNLRDQCNNSECCLSSVAMMEEHNYPLAENGSCPAGYEPSLLRCLESYTWCEPATRTMEQTPTVIFPKSTAPINAAPTDIPNTTVNIPYAWKQFHADWKQFTATDPDLKISTTLALPPGYSFRFTGSEFMIQDDADALELWEYSTSISRAADGQIVNSYTGGSRRAWYRQYLAKKQENFQVKDTIQSVKEVPFNQTSYLVITVETPAYDASGNMSGTKQAKHFIYVQNNIVHILTPSSSKAYTADAEIPANISTLFASLASQQIP